MKLADPVLVEPPNCACRGKAPQMREHTAEWCSRVTTLELNILTDGLDDRLATAIVEESGRPVVEDPFTSEERAAWQAISHAYRLIYDLGLAGNIGEIVSAVHVMQSFVVQHMLHRRWPGEFSSWFRTSPAASSGDPQPAKE